MKKASLNGGAESQHERGPEGRLNFILRQEPAATTAWLKALSTAFGRTPCCKREPDAHKACPGQGMLRMIIKLETE